MPKRRKHQAHLQLVPQRAAGGVADTDGIAMQLMQGSAMLKAVMLQVQMQQEVLSHQRQMIDSLFEDQRQMIKLVQESFRQGLEAHRQHTAFLERLVEMQEQGRQERANRPSLRSLLWG